MDGVAYWDSYHASVTAEWYGDDAASHACLSGVRRALGDASPLSLALHVGCGSSLLGDALERGGAPGLRVVSTDFSPVCIAWQRRRRPSGAFAVADVRDDARAALGAALGPAAAAAGADLVVDKGTFDALLQRGGGDARAAADAADALAALLRGTRCWAGGSRGERSAVALISIIAPAVRMPVLVDALRARLGLALAPEAPAAAAAAAVAAAGARICDAAASADGRVALTAVAVPLPPLEMPGQAESFIYYLTVLAAA
jgi:hypothetical protein